MATEDDECEPEQIYIFLNNHCYSEGCKKRALHKKASSYMVENGLLFHWKAKMDQVPRCVNERSTCRIIVTVVYMYIFLLCISVVGHLG